jgi:hypothetical protein
MSYAVEVRSAEDCRLLGHVNVPVPSYELPPQWTFALRGSIKDRVFHNVTLQVDQFAYKGHKFLAFKVPAAQWAEIKDKVR